MNTRRHPILHNSSSSGNISNYSHKGTAAHQVPLSNKENVAMVRNVHRERSNQKEERQSNSRRKNIFANKENNDYGSVQKNNWHGTRSGLIERVMSTDVRVMPSSVIRSNYGRMAQSQDIGQSVQSRRKKSVRFSEQKLEVLQKFDSKKSLNLKEIKPAQELHRNRSNSILKNKIGNSQELRFKSNSLLKDSQNSQSISSGFSISQYKNTIVRERYHQLLKFYAKKEEQDAKLLSCSQAGNYKYVQNKAQFSDNNFFLLNSSVFRNKNANSGSKVKWMRLCELYRGKKVSIVRKGDEESKVQVIREGEPLANPHFLHFLNLVKNSKSLLLKIFQNGSFNESGIYMLKIFQSHEWKCVIIDDFIPVVEESSRTRPLFTCLREHSGDELQLWPLLLQKAYASILGCYQQLHDYRLTDYFVQLLGLPLHKLALSNDKKGWKEDLKNAGSDSIIFGYSKIETANGGDIEAPKRISIHGGEQASFQNIYTHTKTKVNITDLKRVFKEIFMVRVSALQFYTSAHISSPSRFGQSIKNKKCFSDKQVVDVKRQKPIVKTFKVTAHEQVSVIIKRKVYSYSGNTPKNAVWFRAFLMMKEPDGYRWIQGRYNCESLSFSCVLEPGDYYVLILPDWTTQNSGQLTLLLYSRVSALQIQSYNDSGAQSIIEKGCSDYVQRFGSMVQVNKWICTYAMVDLEAGLMIQNINNERRHGKVRVLRSINNLKPDNCLLLPFNDQFFVGGQMKSQIEINMSREQSYTVILMLFGGRDDTFLGTFNFGL